MVEIKDIKDAESLRAWLSDRQQEDAVVIAHRVAMRLLPIYLEKVIPHLAQETIGLTATPILWANLISGVMAFYPTSKSIVEIKRCALKSATTVLAIAKTSNDAVAFAKSNPLRATFDHGIPASINLCASAASLSCFIGSKSSLTLFPFEFQFDEIVADTWDHVRTDCVTLDEDGNVANLPLWTDAENLHAELWSRVKTRMRADHEGWSFWIKWYEAALKGEPLNLEMLERIALILSDDWEQGPKHVNGLIAAIEAEFELKAKIAELEGRLLQISSSGRGIGDNQGPPMEDEPVAKEIVIIWEPLQELKAEIEQDSPSKKRLLEIAKKIGDLAAAILKWTAQKADLAVNTVVKVGTSAAVGWVVIRLTTDAKPVASMLSTISDLVVKWAGYLP